MSSTVHTSAAGNSGSAFDPNQEKPWLQYYPEWTDHSLEYGTTTLPEMYLQNLEKNANKPAATFFGRTLTFAELDRDVRRAAAGLKAFGVREGDRVAIMLPNLSLIHI